MDEATDIAVGPDSTVFASGQIGADCRSYAIAAVNTGDGSQRWLHYFWHGGMDNRAMGVAYHDGRVFGAGYIDLDFNSFTVTAYDADSGRREWIWNYSAGTNLPDKAYDVAAGPDGNVYACGRSIDSLKQRFTVASLEPGGARRWLYCDTSGPYGQTAEARELAIGADNRIYAAGWRGAVSPFEVDEAEVHCLDSAGVLQWIYRFDNIPGQADLVEDIALGSNGRVYAVGSSYENGSGQDMLILCLDAVQSGMEEGHNPQAQTPGRGRP